MTDKQIKAADAIFRDGTTGGTTSPTRIFAQNLKDDLDINDITNAAEYLSDHGFIAIITSSDENQYRLTDKGIRFKDDGNSIADYLKLEQEKVSRQLAKEEREEKTKDAQLQKLEAELVVLKDMQAEQRRFWQSGIDRDKRHRWQFWLTFMVGTAGFLLSVINFIKLMIIK